MANVVVMNRRNNTFLKGGLDHPVMVSQYTQAHTMFIPKRESVREPIMQAIAAVLGVSRADLEILST